MPATQATTERQPCTRRSFLRRAPVALTPAVLVGTQTVSRVGADGYEWEDDGDTIYRTDDLDELRVYKPFLNISSDSRREFIGFYGFKAESPDHDTDAYVYWARYTHQDAGVEQLGVIDYAAGILASDSHLWDHEPSHIFVDSQTGEVEKAVVTGYHHYPIEISGDTATLTESEGAFETHLNLTVIDPWHHYTFSREEDGANPEGFGRFESLLEVRNSWERQGIFENSSRLAIDNPWAIDDGRVNSWWDEDTSDARAARWWYRLGLRGADDASRRVGLSESWF